MAGKYEHSADVYASLNTVLNLDRASREHFGEVLGHVRVLNGLRERRKHLLGELTRAVNRSGAGILIEESPDIVVQS